MRRALLVGPFMQRCDFAPSPATRMSGYRRYLPLHGWGALFVVPACRCTLEDATRADAIGRTAEGDIVFDGTDAAALEAVQEVVREWVGNAEAEPLVLRPALRAGGRVARWIESADAEDKMSRHLTPLTGAAASGPRPTVAGWWTRAVGHQAARRRMLTAITSHLATSFVPDVVLGSHGYAPEVRAAAAAAARGGAPFVLEMRDALTRGWRPAWEAAELSRVWTSARQASGVVHVTADEAGHDRWWLARRAQRAVIEAGFDAEEWSTLRGEAPVPRDFVLRFTGSLLPQRDLSLFGRVLDAFIASAPADRADVSFEYYGASVAEAQQWAATLGPAREHVKVVGRVDRRRACLAMASATALVLPTFPGAPGGRFYEYLGSGRPILAVGPDDPAVTTALRRTGAGVAVEDPDDAARVLEDWLGRFRAGRPLTSSDESALRSYTRERRAGELASFFDRLAAARR